MIKSLPLPPLMLVNGLSGRRVHRHERADRKGIVVLFARKPEVGLVVIDGEDIVADAAVDRRREVDTVAQVAAGGRPWSGSSPHRHPGTRGAAT